MTPLELIKAQFKNVQSYLRMLDAFKEAKPHLEYDAYYQNNIGFLECLVWMLWNHKAFGLEKS